MNEKLNNKELYIKYKNNLSKYDKKCNSKYSDSEIFLLCGSALQHTN